MVVVLGGSVVGGSDVVVVGAVVVVVTGGCVVVGAAARANGIVVDVGNNAELGRVETFGALALAGEVELVFFAASVVDVVVLGGPTGSVVVVLVTVVVGPNLAAVIRSVWSCMLIGWSSLWTVTNKATTARRTAVTQLHCSIRR